MSFYIDKKDIDNNITGTIATFDNLDIAIHLYISVLEEDTSNTIYSLGIKYFSEITENMDLDILYSINAIDYNKLSIDDKSNMLYEILGRVKSNENI